MQRIVYLYGISCGLIIILYSLVSLSLMGDFTGVDPTRFCLFQALGYLRYLLLTLTIYFALRAFRNQEAGPVNFRPLLRTGVLLALVVAVMIGLMEGAYVFFNPDFYDHYMAAYIRHLQATGAGEEEVRQIRDSMSQGGFMKTPLANGLYYFFETACIGNIATLALAMFMRNRSEV